MNGHSVFHDDTEIQADTVILNTCGFILDAKQESIDTILQYLALKKLGKVKKVIVMGCLSERYRNDLFKELPEVDGFFGVWDHKQIIEATGSAYIPDLSHERIITTPSHYAYLKISEGCNRRCSFCAIPGIRGKQRSKRKEDLFKEAIYLAEKGAKELILIAQDLTNYGTDLGGENLLAELIEQLSSIPSIEWIRLHYAYPTGFPEKVIKAMAENPKVCKYLDIPFQHINDRILKSMNRGHDRKKLEALLNKLRKDVPGLAIRTTLLLGYPDETEEEFEELFQFVKSGRFDRLGVFSYSHEEDTPASKLVDNVSSQIKEERVSRIMRLQQAISLEINEGKIGSSFKTIIDREDTDYYYGRTQYDSPEVDNEVLIIKNKTLQTGRFYDVKITDALEFDLFGFVE
jgi:ribosomal protein S12 methylthiotransferase